MTNAAQMYEGVLIELDQYQSAEFDAQDFNYFMPKAVEKLLKPELDALELTQKVTDKLRPLITVSDVIPVNPTNATDVRKITLPEDYRHVVSVLVRLRYKTATTAFALNSLRSDYSKRLTGDSQAFINENSYLRPLVSDASLRVYHRVIGNEIHVVLDTPKHPESRVVIQDIVLEYIRTAPEIRLNNDLSIDQDTVFPSHFNKEFVTACAKLFLENEESSRLQAFDVANN